MLDAIFTLAFATQIIRIAVPYVLAAHAPRIHPTAARLGPLPVLAMFGLRAITGSWAAVRSGRTASGLARGLALVAGVTAVDALGALAAPAVYRWIA